MVRSMVSWFLIVGCAVIFCGFIAGCEEGQAKKTVDEIEIIEPVVETAENVAKPIVEVAENVAKPIAETAEAVVKPVAKATEEVVKPIAETAEKVAKPIAETVEKVAKPIAETAEKVVKPIAETAEKVVKPVAEATEKIVEPIAEVAEKVVEPVAGAAAAVVKPLSAAPQVVLTTTMGDVVIELNSKKAPITVKNFLRYVNDGFYDGLIFHRVIPGFMIQGGGFDAKMIEKDTYLAIKNESKNGLGNARGTIAMARKPQPDSATSQFFINVNNNTSLNYGGPNGVGYAVFGKVIKGMDIVDAIVAVPSTTKRSNKGMNLANNPVKPILIKSAKVK